MIQVKSKEERSVATRCPASGTKSSNPPDPGDERLPAEVQKAAEGLPRCRREMLIWPSGALLAGGARISSAAVTTTPCEESVMPTSIDTLPLLSRGS